MDALDRPVWSALTGPQARLATGGGAGWRIDPGYGPFAAAAPGHEAALARLLRDHADTLWLIEPAPVAAPPGCVVRRTAHVVQMIADAPVALDPAIAQLGEADVPAMTALAQATQPGPWGPLTWRYGPFYGIWREGRLIAMAGERMRPDAAIIEVSGVCTDPAWRGQGLAAALIRRVMAGHRARGAASFLHSFADNEAALALYRSLGLVRHGTRVVTVLGKA